MAIKSAMRPVFSVWIREDPHLGFMKKGGLYVFGLVVAALVALGLVVLTSASGANAARLHHGDVYFFMKRQFCYLAVGIVIAVAVAMFDYRRWRDQWVLSVLFYGIVFAMLWLVFRERAINGSHRWIPIGSVNVQPSEFAKLATVILVSVFLDKAGWRVEQFVRGAVVPAMFIGLMALPIVLEPDFGSTMVVAASGFVVMFVAGVRILHFLPLAAAGAGLVAYKVLTNANRMARIFAFAGMQPSSVGGAAASAADAAAERASYQAMQSLVAIQRGGITGVGLRNSMQKHAYLPEAHTDFIFAIGAEELGLGFSIAVVLLFCAFFGISVWIARTATDRLGRYLAFGMAFLVFFQAIFNLGVVCEALPTKGMALPFFSYGGTNMLSAFFAVGTILSVGIRACRASGHIARSCQ